MKSCHRYLLLMVVRVGAITSDRDSHPIIQTNNLLVSILFNSVYLIVKQTSVFTSTTVGMTWAVSVRGFSVIIIGNRLF